MNYGMTCGVSVGYVGIWCGAYNRGALLVGGAFFVRVLQGPRYQDTVIARKRNLKPARNESHPI